MIFYLTHRSSALAEQRGVKKAAFLKASRRGFAKRLERAEFLPAVLLFLVLLLQLWVRIENISVRYDLERERSVSLKLDSELRQLRLDYAYVTRHNYLKDKAFDQLALAPRAPSEVRILRR